MEVQMGSDELAKLAMFGMQQLRAEDYAVIDYLTKHGSRPPKSAIHRSIEDARAMVVEGVHFDVVAAGGAAMMLLGPDGVVYKASRESTVEYG